MAIALQIESRNSHNPSSAFLRIFNAKRPLNLSVVDLLWHRSDD